MTNGAIPAVLTGHELRQREKQNLILALKKSNWKIHGAGGAAEILAVKPTTLISRLKKLGLKRPDSKVRLAL